jgi:hypothetical protein
MGFTLVRRQGLIARLIAENIPELHREAVALFEGFAEHGDNAEMQAAAQEAVGVLREHLEMVRQAKGH